MLWKGGVSMNKEDKDIFDFMNSLSEEDSMKLLEGIDFDNEELSKEQKNRIKTNVINSIEQKSRKRSPKLRNCLIAASVAALFMFTGFTPSGQKAVAEIIKKLYFIPGIGKVEESKGQELYVLPKPIKASYNGGELIVKSVLKSKSFLTISLEGNQNIDPENFKTIYIIDDSGKIYEKPGYSLGRGSNIWSGSLGFDNIPQDMNSFSIILPDKNRIHIALSIAESFSDYKAMGPTDIKNDLGITLVPAKEEGRMQFNLVQHPSKNRKVETYGQQVDLDNYGKFDITVKDDLGRQYDLDYPKQHSSPLSEFYFVPKEDAKNYTVEIPEVSLKYKTNETFKLPVPTEGELEVNKNFDIDGFTLTVKKLVRTANNIRVYVDTNYDSNKTENLSEIRIESVNYDRSFGYGWNLNKENRTVEYYDFEVRPKDKSIRLKLSEFNTILKGPWIFKF
jgi:hypothetical protein